MRSRLCIAAVLVFVLAGVAVAQERVRIVDDPTDTRIPKNSKVYIARASGFEQYWQPLFARRACLF